MSWLIIKKYWDISSAWCRQHWRWLVLFFVFVVVYFFGKNKGRVELIQAKLALKQYEQEKRAIEKAYKTEIELREKAKQKYDNAMKTVTEEFRGDFNSLRMQKEAEIRKRLNQAKNNPAEIDKILEAYLGIKQE
jgi:predicted RNA-binding protein YlxR (DUF448 family)